MDVKTITPRELNARREAGQVIELIDVRTPIEFREVHADGASNEPLDTLNPQTVIAGRQGRLDQPLYVICRSGSRGHQACQRLIAAGHANVVNVEGGTLAWTEAGYSVVRGKKAMSLERQVRIAAGSMVFVGVMLGYFVHPIFLGLSGFVGAGLVFAGITDTCGMGLLLARMPWNQLPKEDTKSEEKPPVRCAG
jgi:rhodanese-related sulfurtransferase